MSRRAEVEDLRIKLELAEAKNALMEAREKIAALEMVRDQMSSVIKENTALLIRQRLPPRPNLNWTAKALIAQELKNLL